MCHVVEARCLVAHFVGAAMGQHFTNITPGEPSSAVASHVSFSLATPMTEEAGVKARQVVEAFLVVTNSCPFTELILAERYCQEIAITVNDDHGVFVGLLEVSDFRYVFL